MKIKYIVCILSLFVILLFTGCSGDSDWMSGEITINGTEIALPFSYRELEKIQCKSAGHYYNNISDQYVFNEGEEAAQLIVLDTVKGGILSLGCVNAGGTPCTLPNVSVNSIAAEAKNDRTKADLILPGGITWGASVEDIVDSYGEPEGTEERKAGEYDDQMKRTRLFYNSEMDSSQTEAGVCSMMLEVHDEKGLQKMEYSVSGRNVSAEDETAAIQKRILTGQPVSAGISSLKKEWQQPSVQFGDKSFGFPLTVADLQELGFSFSDEGGKTILNPENTESRRMTSDKYGEIIVELINMDTELRTPDNVWVDEIVLDAGKLKDLSGIRVTGGIRFGAGADDVARVFQGGPEPVRSDYDEEDTVVGENYEYSLADAATEQSLYRFGIHDEKGVQRITIKKHRYKFPMSQKGSAVPEIRTVKKGKESSGVTSSVTLPENVADHYQKAKYHILKKDGKNPDSYLIAGGGTDVSLHDNVLSTELKSNVVVIADKSAGKTYDISMYLKEETEEAKIYVTHALLQRDSTALGGHQEPQTLDASVTVRQDKETGDCKPMDARIDNEDLFSMASRVQLDLNLFFSIRYGAILYTPKKMADGTLKPVAEWEKKKDVAYSDYVPGNEYEIQLHNVSGKGDYAIIFEVTDQNGQVYVSDIQKVNK